MSKSVLSAAANLDIAGLGKAILNDLTALKAKIAALVTDITGLRTKTAAAIVDLTEVRTKEAAAIVDITEIRTKLAAAIVDITAMRARSNLAMLSPAGLAIASGKKTATASNSFCALVAGTLVHKAAGDMSALVGTLATAKSALWAFYIDSAGTITTSTKTADADTAAAAFALMPAVPADKVQIGYMIVSNATGSDFVGGTTDLDTGSLTVVYVNMVGLPTAPVALTTSAPAALTTSAPAALTTSAPAALTASAPADLETVS